MEPWGQPVQPVQRDRRDLLVQPARPERESQYEDISVILKIWLPLIQQGYQETPVL